MKIARIVSSDSHITYVARVIDGLDAAEPPAVDDYGFGQFIKLRIDDATEIVGVIYDSVLVNPEYSNFGPRLSPVPDLGHFTPDFLNEQGVLLRLLLLGGRENGAPVRHGVPRRVVPAGQDVFQLEQSEVRAFHIWATMVGCRSIITRRSSRTPGSSPCRCLNRSSNSSRSTAPTSNGSDSACFVRACCGNAR